MKKIGLVGGTGPESTLLYYRKLNKEINELTLGKVFPEVAIESVNMYKAVGMVTEGNYDELTDYLYNAIHNLENGGADFVALTAATMHIVYDRLAEKVKTPFISIPEAAADYTASRGYKTVGLLGTIFTMEKDFLSSAFVDRGIQVVVPDTEDRKLINDRIANELDYGIVKESTIAELVSVIQKMKTESGIEAVILGCTELPLALNEDNCSMACIDIMETHIQKLVKLCMDDGLEK